MSKRSIGISYSRFSDPKQGGGDSQDRQDEMFRAFCLRHDLTPLREVFSDKGRSGYHDKHRRKGRLGDLVGMARDGHFDKGSVLVVEAWDRLGRLRPDKQTELVAELLRTGVRIGVCRLDDIFCEDDFGTHKWTTLAVFIQLAYQESKQKAERIEAQWKKRRKLAREGGSPLGGNPPAWLHLVDGKLVPVPERVAALKRVFELSALGLGRAAIVARLTAEGFESFGHSGRWTRSYVHILLNDGRVRGLCQPRLLGRKPEGEAIAGLFPEVVTPGEWLAARAGQDGRKVRDKRGRAGVRSERRQVNLFRGLLTNARDGEGFFLDQHVRNGRKMLRLRGYAGSNGNGKECTFPYAVFERLFLEKLREVRPQDVLPRKGQGPSPADLLREKLQRAQAEVQMVLEELRKGSSPRLLGLLREWEAEEVRLGSELQDELARSVEPLERTWEEVPSLLGLVETLGDEGRLKLRQALRRVVEGIHALFVRRGSFTLAGVQVHFRGGCRRDYLMMNQSAAGRHRPGTCSVRSLAGVPGEEDLDFRRADHVSRLEAALLQVPLGG